MSDEPHLVNITQYGQYSRATKQGATSKKSSISLLHLAEIGERQFTATLQATESLLNSFW